MIKVVTSTWSDGRDQEVLVDADDFLILEYGPREGVLQLIKDGVFAALFYNWNHLVVVKEGDAEGNPLVYEKPRAVA